jgi:hypothetical protein
LNLHDPVRSRMDLDPLPDIIEHSFGSFLSSPLGVNFFAHCPPNPLTLPASVRPSIAIDASSTSASASSTAGVHTPQGGGRTDHKRTHAALSSASAAAGSSSSSGQPSFVTQASPVTPSSTGANLMAPSTSAGAATPAAAAVGGGGAGGSHINNSLDSTRTRFSRRADELEDEKEQRVAAICRAKAAYISAVV